MKRSTGRGDLCQAPFDRGVDVFIRVPELELTAVELALDAAEAALDGGELRAGKQAGLGQATRVGDAARDVERVELEIRLE